LAAGERQRQVRIEEKDKMGLWQAVSMAVGTMIGASIFSIFGVGARIAKGGLPEAFLLSALYALAVGYSYARLGGKIVSNAGPVAFILRGLGDNVVTGALSVLLWVTYVISISLFARGFAGYFLPLAGAGKTAGWTAAVVVAVIVIFTVLNFFGSRAVGKAEMAIVAVKLVILGTFVAAGMLTLKLPRLTTVVAPHASGGILHASVLFFLSYMGFGLITNASENIRQPEKTVPRAIFLSIFIAMVVYVAVALTAVGNLPAERLAQVGENALAVAARPFLGQTGFLLLSVGALFSISSALNATLYGGANVAYALAREGELPEFFERKVWFGSTEGLYLTAVLSIAFALAFDLNGIASITSAVFTLIYLFVLVAHWRLLSEVGGNRVLLTANFLLLCGIFMALLYFQWLDRPTALLGTALVLSGAIGLEAAYRFAGRKFSLFSR
jgi:amino acid transporter